MTAPEPPAPAESPRQFAGWLAALFLTVLGAKLWLIQLYGSPLWLWDQWYEAQQTFAPWLTGHLAWRDYFAPYCEHRIFFTRLLDMGVIAANGRLEPMLQMAVNAVIHTLYACGLAFWLWDFMGRRRGWLICCLLLPFFTLPYAAENTLWAFNSQAYLLGCFALPALAWPGFEPPGTWRWWVGIVAAVLGLFTMASGLFTPLAIAGLMIFRTLKSRRIEKANLLTFGVCAAILCLGASLLVKYDGDAALRAQNAGQFFAALLRNLTWPFIDAPYLAALIVLPLLALAVVYILPRFNLTRAAEFLLLLGLWSFLQSLAIAYGRGNYGEDVPSSRYMDKLNVFVIAAIFAVFILAQFWLRPPARRFAVVLPLIFAALMLFGLVHITQLVVDNFVRPTRMMTLVAEERVETFRATGDADGFMDPPTVRPDAKVILGILRDPVLQPIMPAACLAPSADPVHGHLTAATDWLLRHALWLLYGGLGLAVVLLAVMLARSPLGIAWENLPAGLVLLVLLGALGFVWTRSPIRRETVEHELQVQLTNYFTAQHKPDRAAIHAQKAKALEAAVPAAK